MLATGVIFTGSLAIFHDGTSLASTVLLRASDAQGSDYFGEAVAISGDGNTIIVGAYGEDGGSGNPAGGSGAVYVFSRNNGVWTEQAILRASDPQVGDQFGYSVAINSSGDTIIVGAYSEDGGSGNPAADAGAAYVFTQSGGIWSQQAILHASDRQPGDYFGYSVAISSDGNTALMGAYGEDGGSGDPISITGAAYVFTRTGGTWSEQSILRAGDRQSSDYFGYAVNISGDGNTAILGAYGEDGGTGNPAGESGAAYVFTRSGSVWTQQAILRASDFQAGDQFGYTVSINSSGDTVVVGARGEDGGSGNPLSNAGAAYVFTQSGGVWSEQAILRASDAQAVDRFANSVSISSDGNTIVSGASRDDGINDATPDSGAAYVFSRSGGIWSQ